MNQTNAESAAGILFEDPETGEELRPSAGFHTNDNGSICLKVENRDGSRKWMHTIKTEEM